MTKLDVFSGFDRLCVATRYRGEEEATFDRFPYHQSVLHHAVGEYEELPGWREDISECRTASDLPASARDYLRFVSEAVGVPITLIGVGPGRERGRVGRRGPRAVAPEPQAAASGHLPGRARRGAGRAARRDRRQRRERRKAELHADDALLVQ